MDEARIAAEGVVAGIPDADGLVADLGGGSLDMVPVKNGQTGAAFTLPFGPLRLMDQSKGDPGKAREYGKQGLMPNFAKLEAEGCFHELATACPSISPVAWSTFTTGVDASRHNIYDFLTRDPCNYMPMLSSAESGEPSETWWRSSALASSEV